MTPTRDEPDPATGLLEQVRGDLARAEQAHLAAAAGVGADRLYERVLRYRRLIAMIENRSRIARWRVSGPASLAG